MAIRDKISSIKNRVVGSLYTAWRASKSNKDIIDSVECELVRARLVEGSNLLVTVIIPQTIDGRTNFESEFLIPQSSDLGNAVLEIAQALMPTLSLEQDPHRPSAFYLVSIRRLKTLTVLKNRIFLKLRSWKLISHKFCARNVYRSSVTGIEINYERKSTDRMNEEYHDWEQLCRTRVEEFRRQRTQTTRSAYPMMDPPRQHPRVTTNIAKTFKYGESLVGNGVISAPQTEEEIITYVTNEYSNPPVSGSPYIGESGYSGSPGISASGMIFSQRQPMIYVQIDPETRRIYSIARTYGGEIEFQYGGPSDRRLATLQPNEIRSLATRRNTTPIRFLGSLHPQQIMRDGDIEWVCETISGEVFTT